MTLRRLLTAVIVALGCTAPPPGRVPDCRESQISPCLCEGGRQGLQTCRIDRTWGACGCADAGAGTTPPPTCDEPFARCAGACVSLLVDSAHCGRCGAACGPGQICFAGNCALLADGAVPGDVAVVSDGAVPDDGAVPSDIPNSDGDIADTPNPDDASPGDASPGD